MDKTGFASARSPQIFQPQFPDLASSSSISDLSSLGSNTPTTWYMVSAVVAHELAHVGEFEASFNGAFLNLRSSIEALSVPYRCGDTAASAKAAIQALPGYKEAVDNAIKNGENAYGAIPDPISATNSAENSVVDSVIAATKK